MLNAFLYDAFHIIKELVRITDTRKRITFRSVFKFPVCACSLVYVLKRAYDFNKFSVIVIEIICGNLDPYIIAVS